MNTPEELLRELYQQAPRDTRAHELACRYAPILRFDRNEPFLPVAAGYTLFEQDGPSPSMKREIHLQPEGQPAAVLAIEYAIWWDWDVHHLYELEHTWVYVDSAGKVVRLEGSWHGEYNKLVLQLEDGRGLFFSEPGKHAFASTLEPFQKRARAVQRSETLYPAPHAGVLINQMFEGKIRQQVFDQTLVRSFLAQQAFEATWNFTQRFAFDPTMLVEWDVLSSWIPRRVNAVLEDLERTIQPADYRPLRLFEQDGSPAGLDAAVQASADGVVLPLHCDADGRPNLDFEFVFQYLQSVPMGTMIEILDEACIPALARWVTEKKLYQYSLVTAREAEWLARFKALVPRAHMVLQAARADGDALQQARSYKASHINLHGVPASEISAGWVAQAHQAGLGVMGGPALTETAFRALEVLGIDAVWGRF